MHTHLQEAMADNCILTSLLPASGLEDILERCQSQVQIVFGLVYGSMHTNMHTLPKGTQTGPVPKAAKKLMGVTLYLPQSNVFSIMRVSLYVMKALRQPTAKKLMCASLYLQHGNVLMYSCVLICVVVSELSSA